MAEEVAPDLYIEAIGYGGADVYRCIEQLCAIANKIGVGVWCLLNGTRVLARVNDDVERLKDEYRANVARKFPRSHVATRLVTAIES